ncbi:Hypp5042 [Branchiostoma lanceolatum]|uniref:Hypp5042 protein n=1 Tax=Branchiostoma lanceolatum TaxID=7740 RepID=A0A8K0ABV6_BRALA|nr:Hypp5042 [Branchiostoma lanceolatum]
MAATAENIPKVLAKLQWMREQHIWPNGLRYLWTDAHGVCLLVSLYKELQEEKYLQEAESVVADVYRVLGWPRGLRIGEEPDRDGQYFHYLTKWMYALYQLGKVKPEYHERAVNLAKDVHQAFYVPGVGVRWKMLEDLSGPYPGYGLGGLDFYDGFVTYRLLDPAALSAEIVNMQQLVMKDYKKFSCTQDLGLGECLWMSHFFPDEEWAKTLRQRSEVTLDSMWVPAGEGSGYFCRHPAARSTVFGFTNFGVSYGLQSVGLWPDRVSQLHEFFHTYKSGDAYDTKSITHVMHCNSLVPGVMLA